MDENLRELQTYLYELEQEVKMLKTDNKRLNEYIENYEYILEERYQHFSNAKARAKRLENDVMQNIGQTRPQTLSVCSKTE